MMNTDDIVDTMAKPGFRCQVEGYHHGYSSRAKSEAKLHIDSIRAEILTLNEKARRTALSQMGQCRRMAA